MSLNGVSNTVFPNTLNGLDSLDVTNITIDGQSLASLFVPYTGAQSNVDLNAKSLTGVNSISASAVTASGLVQGQNVTATALTTTDTIRINTVPAGTTAKYLATNATGDVIEADITTKYVPYTGATSHVNLNAKNLSNVLTYSGTNVQVTSTETTSLLATGTTQVNTLRITNVQVGTQHQLLAVDSSGNVINGTIPVPTTIDVTVIPSSATYYPIWVNGTAGGNRTLYSDGTFQTLSYDTGARTLSTYQLKVLNVPAGTQTSILAVDSSGNVIQGTAPAPTQLLTTEITLGGTPYYPALVQDRATGVKSIFNENSLNTGNMYFSSPGSTGGLGTWRIPQLVINNAITLINARFATTPSIIPIASVSYALGLNASNDVISYVPSNQTAVTATNVFADFNLLFTATSTSDPNIIVNIDSGTNLKYNPATDRLTVPNLTIGTAATINDANLTGVPVAPTAAPGTNTTQVATCAFVIANSGSGFLPLTGGTMTGSITYANTVATPITLSSDNLTAYTYSIRDSFWSLPMLEFTTKTLSTFGSVSFGVPIVINNITSTNLMSLPYSSSATYSKSITNPGGNIFITFTNSTSSSSGSVVISTPLAVGTTLAVNNVVSLVGASNLNFEQTTNNQLIRLPYLTSTSYIRTINNAGGDSFMTFRSSAPTAGTPVVGNVTMGTEVIMGNTVGLYGVNGTSNDGVAMWVTSGGSACGSIVLSDTYGTTMGTATPTTSWGRYFAVGGQVFQDFYGGFEWRGTNTLGATTWSSVATVAKMRVAQMGYKFGSMFDFSTPGDWNDSNSLFVTTGGVLGGTSAGVGIGYNTAFDSGLLVSIAPNVIWKPMRYKANQHDFYSMNTPIGGFNPFGIYSNNAGYMTNSVGAASIGLGGVGVGDLVFQANSSQVMRWFTGTSQRLVLDSAGGLCFGTSGVGLQTITGSPYGSVSTYGNNGWNGYDINRRWCLMGWQTNTEAGFHDNVYSWIWRTTANNFIVDRPSIVFNNVPQQTYYPNQVLVGNNGSNLEWGVMYSTYYYGGFTAWGGGVAVSSFYKASSISNIRISGAASYYIPGGGMYYTECQFYNMSTGNSYYLYQYQYTNFTGNHFSFPICFQFGGLPVGSYNVYLRCNAITDGNDHVYILGEIVPF
jgi:hypothetical protein